MNVFIPQQASFAKELCATLCNFVRLSKEFLDLESQSHGPYRDKTGVEVISPRYTFPLGGQIGEIYAKLLRV